MNTCGTRRPIRRLPGSRGSFTMIEVLTILVILGILMALLLPAIFGTSRAARIELARQRILEIDEALKGNFRGQFNNFYPPSYIVLIESGNYDDSNTAQHHSKQWLQRLWPSITLGGWDFNADGDSADTFTLSGSKCLLFFLYGMPALRKDGGGQIVEVLLGTGFSNDPKDPFKRDGPRVGPFFKGLKQGDIRPGDDDDGDAGTPTVFYEIADPLGNKQSLAFFSSYNSANGYRPDDCNFGGGNQTFKCPTSPTAVISAGPNPYTTGDSNPATGLAEFHNPDGIQIISAGIDGDFGKGGKFTRGGGSGSYPDAADADNLTNFYHGELERAAQEGN